MNVTMLNQDFSTLKGTENNILHNMKPGVVIADALYGAGKHDWDKPEHAWKQKDYRDLLEVIVFLWMIPFLGNPCRGMGQEHKFVLSCFVSFFTVT